MIELILVYIRAVDKRERNVSSSCSAIVAKNIVPDSFAMIFGINGWISSILVFVYNFVVVTRTFFNFSPIQLYVVFGFYFYVLVVIFIVVGAVQWIFKSRVKFSLQ